MPKVATKVAISIPSALYQAVERARKKNGQSRSAFVQHALRQLLRQQEESELARRYLEGYRKKPEIRREIEAAEALAVPALSAEEW